MGKILNMVIEHRVGAKWVAQKDLFTPQHNPGIDFATMRHNGLLEAHLLGCFDVMDPGNAPTTLDDTYRIGKTWFRDIPSDVSKHVKKAYVRDRSDEDTPSVVTLGEIMSFDWTKFIAYKFWVNGPMVLEWLKEDSDMKRLPPRLEYKYTDSDKPQHTQYCEILTLTDLTQMVKNIMNLKEPGGERRTAEQN